MSLAALLGELIESGKITVSKGNTQALEITAQDHKIDVKALDKKIVKETIAAARGAGKEKGVAAKLKGAVNQIKTARSSLDMVKEVAEELREAGVTVTLSYKGSVVVTLGCDADPKFSKAATGSGAIEVNSPRKLVELGL